jgi:hypothetical protein
MTPISSSYVATPTIQSGVTANNGQAGNDGTQSIATPSTKGHHGHHHASSASSSSFSALMNLLGAPSNDDTASDSPSDSSSDPTAATSPLSDLASLGASPLTANDIANAPPSDDPSAILQAMRRYAENGVPTSSGAATVNQSV